MHKIFLFLLLIKFIQGESNYRDGLKFSVVDSRKPRAYVTPEDDEYLDEDLEGEYFKKYNPSLDSEDDDKIEDFYHRDENRTNHDVLSLNSVENDFEGFIMGSSSAKRRQFPYQVSLIDDENDMHICSGTIINKFHIITAAHCLCGKDSKKPTQILVLAGVVDLNPIRNRKYIGQRKFCESDYDDTTKIHDIAVLRINQPFAFSETIRPIKMYDGEVDSDVPVTISGWGDNIVHSETQSRLQFINTKTISFNKCFKMLKRYRREEYLKAFNICTHDKDRKACSGDAGGPVVSNDVLIGIVSWSLKCNDDVPGIHSGIEHHYPWIQDILKDEKRRMRRFRRRQ